MSNLTQRERQVLDLTGQGLRGVQIAERLGISAFTIRKHRSSIMRKTGLRSTARLIAYARDGVVVTDRPPAPPLDWHLLRPREAEVVCHVIAGRTSKEIARLLDISPLTVAKHRERARSKLGIQTLGEMILRGRTPGADDGVAGLPASA